MWKDTQQVTNDEKLYWGMENNFDILIFYPARFAWFEFFITTVSYFRNSVNFETQTVDF